MFVWLVESLSSCGLKRIYSSFNPVVVLNKSSVSKSKGIKHYCNSRVNNNCRGEIDLGTKGIAV